MLPLGAHRRPMRTEADVSLRGQVRLPGGPAAVLKALRFKALRRLPVTFGMMSKRSIPDELFDRLLEPALTNPAIRGDLRK
jgi:hypothetical protein